MRLSKRITAAAMLASLIGTSVAARPAAAYSGASYTADATPCSASAANVVALSDEELAATAGGDTVDAICYVAAVCTGFWPIGTLICGPTTLGCVIIIASK